MLNILQFEIIYKNNVPKIPNTENEINWRIEYFCLFEFSNISLRKGNVWIAEQVDPPIHKNKAIVTIGRFVLIDKRIVPIANYNSENIKAFLLPMLSPI
jgi:hypothetical protein